MYRMKRKILHVLLLLLFTVTASAHEGMWLPNTLQQLVEGDMQENGLKLSAEQIYSINQSSLKDAIVLFGGGCTAELISDQGLILTNHHCGYSQIQSHSTLENDYLKNGFWAMDRSEELPNAGLSATFVKWIENVTAEVKDGVNADMDAKDKNEIIQSNIKRIEKKALDGNNYDAKVKPFFYGNEYYLIVTETFTDIRMVGAPPSSIGKFGGDTDNWMWPRHTGDFSLFRIYASPENEPAAYNVDNIPYTPIYSLPISMTAPEEGDFTMIFGFPARTEQFLSSSQVNYVTEISNPAKIEIRKLSLAVIDSTMESSDDIRIKYAAKQSRISNAYKKWIGQNMGLKRFNAIEKKKKFEEEFLKLANSSPELKSKYGSVLEELEKLSSEIEEYKFAREYFIEIFYYGPELLRFAYNFNELSQRFDNWQGSDTLDLQLGKLRSSAESFFKNYDQATDKRLFEVMIPKYSSMVKNDLAPEYLLELQDKYKNDYQKLSHEFYKNSFLDSEDEVMKFLKSVDRKSIKKLREDPALRLALSFWESYTEKVQPEYSVLSEKENDLMKTYVEGRLELFPEEKYWPDANSTLRLSFGKAEGMEPQDGIEYLMYTTLDGVMDKYIPGDKEFDVPQKLIELYKNRDYGNYASNGEMRVCFLSSNHTTGGNSGSPAINANGELVGLNFDRTWESTMSDIMFHPEICRNIMVDIKYVLFIIDKYAGAAHLIEEMKLVNFHTEKVLN